MSDPRRQLKLGAFLRASGHHMSAWRHPTAQSDAGVNFAHYVKLAEIAERGLFDFIFEADTLSAQEGGDHSRGLIANGVRIEPLTMLTGLAAVTRQIGLICTAATTFDQPYSLARRFASLDMLSGGRAGWNLVTSADGHAAANFGLETQMDRSERYARAAEFARVVRGLWASWDPGAFVRDKASGMLFDVDKMHYLNHVGKYFRVRGPLNVPPSPQGRPILVQAGASEDGIRLAAETADVVFSAHTEREKAQRFYSNLKGRMVAFGREPDDIKIMPGLLVYLGDSHADAQRKKDEIDALIPDQAGLTLLSTYLGYEVYGCALDGPLPLPPMEKIGKLTSRTDLLIELAHRENLTIRQLITRIAGGRGHNEIVGTPKTVADMMEEWFATGAADGFNIMPPLVPSGLEDFVRDVVPELQRRGLFRTHYEGPTLREKLSLRPCRSD